VIEFQLLEDGDRLYLDAEQTVPTPVHTVTDLSPDTSEEPWKEDGESWHLEERSATDTAERLTEVTAALQDIEFLEGPGWRQKHYVSFTQGRKRRIAIRTKRTLFHIDLYDVNTEALDSQEIAEALGLDEAAVSVKDDLRASGRSGVRITCRPGDDLDLEVLADEARRILETE